MSKKKMSEVRRLIGERDFASAKEILQTINHPKAREWEARVDKILAKRKGGTGKRKPSTQRNAKASSGGGSMRRRLFLLLTLFILVAVIVVVAMLATSGDDDTSNGGDDNTVAETNGENDTTIDDTNDTDNDTDGNSGDTDTNMNNVNNTFTLDIDRSDPLAVGEALILAAFQGNNEGVLFLVCEADLATVNADTLIFGITAGLTEGRVDVSGLNVELISVDGNIATLEFFGEVILIVDNIEGVAPIDIAVEVHPDTYQIQNTDGQWGLCSQ